MPTAWGWLNTGLSALGVVLALALALAVYGAGRERRTNRALAALLLLQGLLQAVLVMQFVRPSLLTWPPLALTATTLLAANGVTFVLFCGTLGTPWTRPLRKPVVRALVALAGLAVILPDVARLAKGQGLLMGDTDGLAWMFLGIASIAALVFTIDAWRRTDKGSPAHKRSFAFMLAFGARDIIFGGGITLFALSASGVLPEAVQTYAEISGATSLLVFVPLLAYGILSTQLFDIDLRIKWGISRSTVVTIGVVAVLGALKTVEYSFNRTLGAVAAGLVAGIVLVLAPRLNKLGDKVANAAMPAVQPTSQYVAYKKLEVYRAAVESALESDGKIDDTERAMLDRMRVKLGVPEADAQALEAELAGASA